MNGLATEIFETMERSIENQSDRRLPFGHKVTQLGAAVVVAAVGIIASAGHPGRDGQRPDVTLLYVGAEDCAPCRGWLKGEGADFLASEEFTRIAYREVRSPHLEDVLSDENWPQDIREYRNSIRRSDGVPLWLVISEHVVVERQSGTTAWRSKILPLIKFYLR
jgi:hypothetical protein